MKKYFILFTIFLFALGCSEDTETNTDITVTIEASGLSDDKLAVNNSANFTAVHLDYEGDASSLSYRWSLISDNGELSSGTEMLPNPSIHESAIYCFGRIAGDEQIVVEVLDVNNNIIGSATYDFTIVSPTDPITSYGCFDQPKIVYRRGTFNYAINFDGSNEEYLGVGGGSGVVISPNGEWIAQCRDNTWGWLMHVFRCDGSTGLIPIDDLIYQYNDARPRFSLDSEKLYFLKEREGPDGTGYYDIAAYNLSSGQLSFITSLYQEESEVADFTVSPVTGDIAFFSRKDGGLNPDGTFNIIYKLSYLQPESGLITSTVNLPAGGYVTLDWSPDGSNIIFDGTISDQHGIYKINTTDGSQPLLLFPDQTPNTVGPHNPHYYEGGSRIVFVDQDEGQPSLNLWTIDANGEDKQALMDESSGNLFLWGVLH